MRCPNGTESKVKLREDIIEGLDQAPQALFGVLQGKNYFDPLTLPDGIAGSDDPLLSARSAAYAESFTRREGEHKEPSAVATAKQEK